MAKVKDAQWIVRSTRSEDLPGLAQAYVELYDFLNIGERWSQQSAQSILSYWFERYPDIAFTAECNDKMIGAFVAGIKPWWDGNHLYDGEMFVHHRYQRLGIGRQLLQKVFEAAKRKYGAVCWEFYTFSGERSPIQWYKKVGICPNDNWAMLSGNINEVLQKIKPGHS